MEIVVIIVVVGAVAATALAAWWNIVLRDYMTGYDAYWSHVEGLGRVRSARRSWAALRTTLADPVLERRRARTVQSLLVLTVLIVGVAMFAVATAPN